MIQELHRYAALSTLLVFVSGASWLYYKSAMLASNNRKRAQQHSILVVDIGSSSVRASAYVFLDEQWVVVPGSLAQKHVQLINADGVVADMKSVQIIVV